MVRADLHVHTTVSDGELKPEAVPPAARQAGLEAVAITDHDRLQPGLDAPVVRRDGVTVVHGIELRVDAGRQRVDLLGYGLDPTPDLEAACGRIQRDRVERARAIVDCVEDRLGVALDVEFHPGVGRPHVARAIADSDADLGYQETFETLIGDGDPCFVSREIPDFETGRRLLDEAAAFVGLAHPLRYREPEHALGLTAELDAVELAYPYDRDVDLRPVRRAIDRHGLLATGGSDAHGRRLGVTGLDADAFARVRKRLPHPAIG
ncbi:PHP domain-containing protein [Halapricum hydrolyticum]|uniref:PHP domain-containing protein n=1 Tax=Halapricum hydrolyticum TaxID=2979991 RepID=A0AAE3LFF5_9EURY|nr:PHP domain-containing protein [Halapricum hydrolyticum]MCU4718648.1 PHP domain-containing protein [Halapricum hydrolyticum]MCU4727666.1 PHP domain-containing protein [Halapricum hydrolyticum]